ncbi:GNAT family N-acetyltransferase [Nocardioides speluncae]|uniref:GNAT family N-acetyltransferase n=1 Tax=Nocardioides speluncae TaxID=2670337 RepID=UPI000D69EBB2|nr:GNAT family N-acetyltransferase [Nocardioides speluncae]
MELPSPLTSRPLTPAESTAVFEVMAAQEKHDLGEVHIEEADIVGDWQRPSFDVSASTIGVYDGDRLVGYAEVTDADRGDAAVDPAYRGRGIGTALAQWMQERARAGGSTVIGQPVPAGSPSDVLLRALGYRERWTAWVLELPAGREVPARPLPDGYSIREAGEADHRAAYTVVEDAFLEWSERERASFEDFSATVFERPGFEPWHLRLALDPDGEVVGTAVLSISEGCASVSHLAVRPDQRNRGLAQALLADAFAQGRAHGAPRSELATDTRTGALSLYEKVGMEPTSTWVNLAIDL